MVPEMLRGGVHGIRNVEKHCSRVQPVKIILVSCFTEACDMVLVHLALSSANKQKRNQVLYGSLPVFV